MKATLILSTFALLLAANAGGQGTILWNESVNGPLSNDGNNPTSLSPLQFGTNTIIAATEIDPTGPSWSTHPDFFTFQVANNAIVSAVFININKPSVWTWLGDETFANQLGFSFGPSTGELLSQLGLTSMPSNMYGMYLANLDQEPFTSIANYRLDFFVQAIPEPISHLINTSRG